MFLGGFFYTSCIYGKRNECSTEVLQNLQLSPHYLIKAKNTQNGTF